MSLFPLGGKGLNPYAPAAVRAFSFEEDPAAFNWGQALTLLQRNREEKENGSPKEEEEGGTSPRCS